MEKIVVALYMIGSDPPPGFLPLESPAHARAFASALPDNEDLIRQSHDRAGMYSHVRYLPDAAQVSSEADPFRDSVPDDKTLRNLEAVQVKSEAEWNVLLVEEAGLPDLLAAAIDARDAPAILATKARTKEIGLYLNLAERSVWEARLNLLYAQGAIAKANRSAAGTEFVRLGPDHGYPEGKDAFDVAKRAYTATQYMTTGDSINNARNRLYTISKALRG